MTLTGLTDVELRRLAEADDRFQMWSSLVRSQGVRTAAEIGVFRGAFAEQLLDHCPGLERYYLLDPWRHLDDWLKPANVSDDVFDGYFEETMRRTEAYRDKRVVLRGTTIEMSDQIPDGSLDFAYIDGDHTLRGVTIDLARIYPKVRAGGFVAGDDFCRNIFQHPGFEPTAVFPQAVHFAEAMGVPIYALGHRQFLIHKSNENGHRFVDLPGGYVRVTLRDQIRLRDRRRDRSRRKRAMSVPEPNTSGRLRRESVRALARLRRLLRRTWDLSRPADGAWSVRGTAPRSPRTSRSGARRRNR